MADSTAAQDFKLATLRAFDAAANEHRALEARIRELEQAKSRAEGLREGERIDPSRITALELKAIAPEEFKKLERAVIALQIRSGMIGAAGGTIATVAIEIAVKFFFSRVAG